MQKKRTFNYRILFYILFIAALLTVALRINPYFLTAPIVVNILQDTALLGILAMAESLVLISGGIDFSLPNLGLLCASMAYYLVATDTTTAPVAILLGILCATALGFVNGFFITSSRINPVIITLAVSMFARGLSGAFTNNIALFDTRQEFSFFSQSLFGVVPVTLLMMFVIMIVCVLVFYFTSVNRLVYAVGGSEHSARLSGLRVNRIKLVIYLTAGFLAGLAGLAVLGNGLLAGRFYDLGAEMEVFFAVLLGGVSLRSGPSVFPRACVGAAVMAVINRMIYSVSIYNYSRAIVTGVAALIVISLIGGIYRAK